MILNPLPIGKGFCYTVPMFNSLFPNNYIASTYIIDFKKYYDNGYRGIIFDVDNTLVPHGAPQDERSLKLLNELKSIGFKVLFLSNNKEERVKTFNEPVDCMYIYKGGKPGTKGYIKAMEMLGTDTDNTMFVGDQIFTDIWGANRANIYSILVKQIDKKEEIQIVLKRKIEWIVLLFYKRFCKKNNREFFIKAW